jgi:hypothetical protein
METKKSRVNIFFIIIIVISVIVSFAIIGYFVLLIIFGLNFANPIGGPTKMETKLNGFVIYKISDSLKHENWKYNLSKEKQTEFLIKHSSFYNGTGLWYFIKETDTTKNIYIKISTSYTTIVDAICVDSTMDYFDNLPDAQKAMYKNLLRETVLKDIEREAKRQKLPNSEIYLSKELLEKYGYGDFAKEIYPE